MASDSDNSASDRPVGQLVVGILLFLNASVCLLYFLIVYLGEMAQVVELQYPVALLFSLNPPLALASGVAPIFIYRRSALGFILAWAALPALFLDTVLSVFASGYYVPLALKLPVDLAIMVTLAIFLIQHATYRNLNVTSYGFPVLARVLGPPAATIHGSQLPSPQGVFDVQVARNIKEAYMQSYVRSANFLRIVALVARIVSLLLLAISLVGFLVLLALVFQEFPASSPSFRSAETWLPYVASALVAFIPVTLSLLLFVSSCILTVLAELLSCQATRQT